MKISLSFKMLILTLGSFLVLITGIIASLFIYFDRFYEPEKINHMVDAINEFTNQFEENEWSEDQLYSEVSKFMKNQNATMSIQPTVELTLVSSGTSPAMITHTSTLPDFLVLNNNNVLENKLLNRLPLLNSEKGIRPGLSFSIGSSLLPALSSTYTLQNDIATATSINGALVLYPINTAASFSVGGLVEMHEKNGVSYTISTIPYTNYRQVNFTKQTTLKNGAIKITNVNLSLQSVDEVMSYLLRFFPFLIVAALFLSMIMVFVYSKTISKPIMKITSTANRMAGMELGIHSDIRRKDELGALSDSLNTLSSNLKNALDDLNLANQKLTLDYENELKQEKARKEFVANVSHELKTPLGIIRSYMEGIRDGVKAEKKDYYMEVILSEVTHMDQMLLEMLEISKFDAGVVTYNKTKTDFTSILNKIIRMYENKARDKKVSFDITGDFGTVVIDKEKIERVMSNLIGNAVKYCNPSSVITVHSEKTADHLTIQIENDCPPFEEEILDRIWDRFYKADTSHNRDTDGTGLGLAITKSIFEGHGCSYGVRNTNHGICFYFTMETDMDK